MMPSELPPGEEILGEESSLTPDPQTNQQQMGESSFPRYPQTNQQQMGKSSSPTKVNYSEDFYTSLKPGQLPRETTPRAETLNVTKESGEKSEPITGDTVKEGITVMLDPSSDPIAEIDRSFSATSKKIFDVIFN